MKKVLLVSLITLWAYLLSLLATPSPDISGGKASGTQSRRPRLSRPQIIRLGRLLNMLYKPSEIADLLGVATDTIYRAYLPAGCPHQRDETGNIWIHGTSFKRWAEELLAERRRPRSPMADGEAWCLKCNKRVLVTNPSISPVNRYLELITGKCPVCGTTVNRAQKRSEV